MIKGMTNKEFNYLLDNPIDNKGLFYTIEGEVYIACDNSTLEAWVEEFDDLDECKNWLLGNDEVIEESRQVKISRIVDKYLPTKGEFKSDSLRLNLSNEINQLIIDELNELGNFMEKN